MFRNAQRCVHISSLAKHRRFIKVSGSPRNFGCAVPVDHRTASWSSDPVHLYIYSVCPYSCKVKAYFDYHRVPYRTTEVNPLTKKELLFSPDYKKVPIAILPDGTQVNESDAIMDRVRAMLETHQKKADLRAVTQHELEWRSWANENLAKALPPNLYRSLAEAFEAFAYISASPHFSSLERMTLRATGSIFMRLMAPKMRKKYGVPTGEERQHLFERLDEFMNGAVYKGRESMTHQMSGLDEPDMADLTVYGMLHATQDMRVFRDTMSHMSDVELWYRRVEDAIRNQQA